MQWRDSVLRKKMVYPCLFVTVFPSANLCNHVFRLLSQVVYLCLLHQSACPSGICVLICVPAVIPGVALVFVGCIVLRI